VFTGRLLSKSQTYNQHMSTRKISRYGWRPDTPDMRDHMYCVSHVDVSTIPDRANLQEGFPKPYDQGELGSCTGNAIAGAYEFDVRRQGMPDFMPSRLFVYYNERVIEGTVNEDSGAEIRDGIKTIAQTGVCLEKTWPYVISKFTKKPVKKAYTEATKHTAVTYKRIAQSLNALKTVLGIDKLPVVFGFSVYESFESDEVAKTGIVPMPDKSEQLLGGHAVVLCGYDDTTKRFLVRNSWGENWGQAGYFTLPYEYVTDPNLASDFWVVQTVKKYSSHK
jgi:C1A family cysteine protease